MYKRLLVAAALVFTITSAIDTPTASANHGENHGNGGQQTATPKIEICHSRQPQPSNGNGAGAQDNPYGPKRIEVSTSAVITEGHSIHNGPIFNNTNQDFWGDVIPPFDGYEGLNWTVEGRAIWANDCQYPALEEPEMLANIKASVICDATNKQAIITFTNTGLVKGNAKLTVGTAETEKIKVKVGAQIIKYVEIPTDGIQIKIMIAKTVVFNELYKCVGGQGTVDKPDTETPTTPTTPDTTATPAADQGTTPTATASETEIIASLPYTAGNSAQMIAVIVSALAALIAVVSTIVKKAYLKQI